MHVLFLTRRFFPHRGGVETHTLEVAKELRKLGHTVTVITEQYDPTLSLTEDQRGIRVVRIPSQNQQKLQLWRWIWQQRAEFEHADVVHVHDIGWWILPVFPLIRKKWFITFHGWEGYFPPKKSAILQRRVLAQLAKGSIQVGHYIEMWYGTRAHLTTYGATTAPVSKPTRHEKQLVVLGRLVGENDVAIILEALEKIKFSHPDIHVTFVGDGPYRKACEKLGEVTGMLASYDSYLDGATIVFANSYLSILDAQAKGRLVASVYSHDLKRDYLRRLPSAENMIISDSADTLAARVVAALDQPKLYSEQVQHAQKWAQAQTWSKLTKHYLDLWRKLLDGIIET